MEEKLIKKNNQLEDKLKEARYIESEMNKRIKQLEEQLDKKDEELDNMLANLDNDKLLDELDKIASEKDELQKKIEYFLKKEEEHKHNDFSKIEFELRKELDEQSKRMNEDISLLNNELESVMTEKMEIEEKLEKYEATNQDLLNVISNLEIERRNLNIEGKDEEIENLKHEIERLSETFENLETKKDQALIESQMLSKSSGDLRQRIQGLEKEVQDRDIWLDSEKKLNDACTKKLEAIDKDLKE